MIVENWDVPVEKQSVITECYILIQHEKLEIGNDYCYILKHTQKTCFSCDLNDFLCHFCVLFYDRLVSPCMQCLLIGTRWLQSLWSIVLGVIVQPFLTSAGKCCGGFSIHLAKE